MALPDAPVISKPVSVPTEINAANWLADYTTTTDPQTEDIELYTDGRIDIKSAHQSPVAAVISINGRVLRST